MADAIEMGVDTFGDVGVDAAGQPLSQAQALRDVPGHRSGAEANDEIDDESNVLQRRLLPWLSNPAWPGSADTRKRQPRALRKAGGQGLTRMEAGVVPCTSL